MEKGGIGVEGFVVAGLWTSGLERGLLIYGWVEIAIWWSKVGQMNTCMAFQYIWRRGLRPCDINPPLQLFLTLIPKHIAQPLSPYNSPFSYPILLHTTLASTKVQIRIQVRGARTPESEETA